MGLLISLLIISFTTSIILLQGITFWANRDVVRGLAYTTFAIALIFGTCVYSVITGMSNVIDEAAQKHGSETISEVAKELNRKRTKL